MRLNHRSRRMIIEELITQKFGKRLDVARTIEHEIGDALHDLVISRKRAKIMGMLPPSYFHTDNFITVYRGNKRYCFRMSVSRRLPYLIRWENPFPPSLVYKIQLYRVRSRRLGKRRGVMRNELEDILLKHRTVASLLRAHPKWKTAVDAALRDD